MNTLTGYSKSRLTDNYVLTAAGGHLAVGNASNNIPLNNSTVNTNLNADLLDGQHGSWYQKNAISFKQTKGVAENQGYDVNTLTEGMVYNYGSAGYWKNGPSGMSYGQVLNLKNGSSNSLSGQLAWDVSHNNTTDTTRSLWWRASDNGTFTNAQWHKIAFQESIPNVTDYYWANIPISPESNDATTPKVLYLYATNGINTSYIRSSSSMSISSAYNIILSANDSSVIKIADTFINPLKDDTVNLGTAYDRWSAIYTKSLTTESLNYRCKGSNEYPKMSFYNNTWTYLGFFGMNSEKKFVIADQSGYSSNYVLHSGNSSVSGDGTYITVKINDVTKTLTIPTASAQLYWADQLISNQPSTTITPTFSSIVLGTDTYNYIKCGTPNSGDDNSLAFVFRGRSTNISNASFIMNYEELYPARDVRYSLGTSSLRWSSVYTYSTYTWAIYCKPSNYNNYIATLQANKDSNGDYYGTLSLGYILDSSYGILSIYGKSQGCARVCYKNTTSNSNLYLPTINQNIPQGTLLYHEDGKQVGNATTPIYINSDGQAVACNPYPTASGLSLEKTLGINGQDYVFHAPNSDVTTSIYAPTTVGTSGYILQSTGSGTPSWTSRLSYDYPGIIWIGYIYRTSRSYTTWYVSKQGGSATVSMYISSPTSSNNYQVALQSSTHNILGGMCSIQAQWNAGKDGGQSTEGPLYAWSTVNVGKIEEAGTEIFVTTAHNGYFYIKALRADDDDNTSYYFDGLAYTGQGRNANSLPLARINVILFGY